MNLRDKHMTTGRINQVLSEGNRTHEWALNPTVNKLSSTWVNSCMPKQTKAKFCFRTLDDSNQTCSNSCMFAICTELATNLSAWLRKIFPELVYCGRWILQKYQYKLPNLCRDRIPAPIGRRPLLRRFHRPGHHCGNRYPSGPHRKKVKVDQLSTWTDRFSAAIRCRMLHEISREIERMFFAFHGPHPFLSYLVIWANLGELDSAAHGCVWREPRFVQSWTASWAVFQNPSRAQHRRAHSHQVFLKRHKNGTACCKPRCGTLSQNGYGTYLTSEWY